LLIPLYDYHPTPVLLAFVPAPWPQVILITDSGTSDFGQNLIYFGSVRNFTTCGRLISCKPPLSIVLVDENQCETNKMSQDFPPVPGTGAVAETSPILHGG
jgi:hypothetical protein